MLDILALALVRPETRLTRFDGPSVQDQRIDLAPSIDRGGDGAFVIFNLTNVALEKYQFVRIICL